MLTPTLNKLAPSAHKKINEIFLDIALSFELGCNWRETVRKHKCKAVGARKRFCKVWEDKQNWHVDRAITVFFEEL